MNKYLIYLKNPKIVGIILLVIVVIIAIVSIIISLKSKTSPPLPKPPPPCPGKQANYCPDGIHCSDKCREDQKWDCTAKACVCINSGFKSCNGNSECCSTCYPDDMCCTGPTQGTIGNQKTGYKKICCPPDTTPGGTGEGCLSSNCGTSKIPCSQGQACMEISGLTGSDFTEAVTYSKADSSWRSDDGSSTLYLCANPSTCEFISKTSEYLPYNSNEGASFYYNTDNIMKDGDNICIPSDSTQYGSTSSVCYTSGQQLNCTDPSCEKKSSFDIFKEDDGPTNLGKHMKIIMGNQNKSEQGYYCGNSNDSFLQYESIYADGTCTWHDCQRELEEPGIIRITWDNNNQKCSALKSNSDSGVRGAVKCTGIGDPCPDCNGPDDYSNCVLCTDDDKPCKGCEKGKYIPYLDCDRGSGLWKFMECATGNNKVLRSFADPDKTCNKDDVICGNCPWGGNDLSSIVDFGDTTHPDQALKSGDKNTLQYVCVSDNQIRLSDPSPTLYCTNQQYVNHDKSACVYACTMDGTDARNYSDDSRYDTIKQYFTAKVIDDQMYCFRNPLNYSYMQNFCEHGMGTFDNLKCQPKEGTDHTPAEAAGYKWDGQCNYLEYPNLGINVHLNDCYATMSDTITNNNPDRTNPDLPIYLYQKNVKEWVSNVLYPGDGEPVNCWTTTRPVDFYYSTNHSPGEGDNTFITHPQADKMIKSEFCSPI